MSESLLMLLADARLPVSGHTQSGSLEPALRGGMTAADIPAYLSARLESVIRVEAGTAVVARCAALRGGPLAPVEQAWAARTPSAAMRATSRHLGRGLLRMARRLWPDHPAVLQVAGMNRPSRAVVLGAVAVASGLPPASLARMVAYDDLQTVAAAALKLEPLDPSDATVWVFDLLPRIESLAVSVATLSHPDDIPAAGSPQIEVWAERHAQATRRLFSA